MNEDLPNELIKPEALQKEITRFNSDVDDYFDDKLPKIILNTLQLNLSDVKITNSDDSLPDNTLSYSYLRHKLNKLWVEKLDFKVRCDNGLCKLDNSIDLANMPITLEANLKAAVKELKTVKTNINLLRIRRAEIILKSKKLSKSINMEIISRIEHRQYKTKCSGCSKY